jgi:C4-dicarboxylate-binding protein DctP
MKMKLVKNTLVAIAASALWLVSASPAFANCDAGEIVIKFSHVTNTDKHPKGIAAALLEERVNKEMNGKACMQVFPNSSLYDDDKVLEALANGDVQLAAPSLSKFEEYTKAYRLFDLPFLFTDINAVDRFQNSADGQKLKDSMTRRGLKGLQFWHNGMKQLSANKPLLVPADAKGLKFRVQASDVLVAQFQELGANPQKMSFSEVYGGLQTKVIDGQENTWSNIYGQKFFEVQDGISETNHGVIDYLVVTSSEWWDQLNPEVRDQFAQILKEVTEARNQESEKVNQEAKQKIVEAGGTIRTLTPQERQAWVDAMKPVWKKFEGNIGPELMNAAMKANGG